jgi:hypothetical protein
MGGMALFFLYYAGHVPDYALVMVLLVSAFKWGSSAVAIAYFEGKYFDQ